MKILIDIGHPAHVHLYKNLYAALKQREHKLFVVVKDIKSAKYLLDYYKIGYFDLGSKKDSIILKGLKQIKYNLIVYQLVKKNNIDLGFCSSITIPHVSIITKMKSIVMDDDDDLAVPLFMLFAHPFCDDVFTPNVIKKKRKDTIYYPGYHELAYLHPKRFKPDPIILDEAGLIQGDSFFIMRFNVFKAYHDAGIQGLSLQQKLKLIEILKPHGKIFVTTERDIEPALREYQLKVSPEKIHSLMAFATMFLGDSQTMTSEAAVLGTPALKCNSFAGRLSVPNELEKEFNLCYSFLPRDFHKMLEKIKELMNISGLKQEWQNRRGKMLRKKIDVTGFWLWFIENYPKSKSMITDQPEFWNQFK